MSGSEKNISDADNADWILGTGHEQIYYWDTDVNDYRYVCSKTGEGAPSINCKTTSFNSWQGYFIYSNYDNITLIRQN